MSSKRHQNRFINHSQEREWLCLVMEEMVRNMCLFIDEGSRQKVELLKDFGLKCNVETCLENVYGTKIKGD